MMTLSGEVRYPIVDQQFYIGGFFDMGNSWNKSSDISLSDMYKGTGLGFRLMLPMVGLLGFDFAWALDNPNESFYSGKITSPMEVHFIMNRGF